MNSPVNYNRLEHKKAEHHVFSELLKRDVLPNRIAGGGLSLNTRMGHRLELLPVASTEGDSGEGRRFPVSNFRPRPELFFLCVEFDGDEAAGVWVLPSTAFYVYSDADVRRGLLELSLDVKKELYNNESFREYNSFFLNRWEPVTQYDDLQQYMKPQDAPDFAEGWEDFEDILMLMESSETLEEEAEEGIPFEPPDPDEDYGQPLIQLTPAAQEDLDSIPPDDRAEVEAAIRSLADNPRPSGSIRLEGTPGNYRVHKIP